MVHTNCHPRHLALAAGIVLLLGQAATAQSPSAAMPSSQPLIQTRGPGDIPQRLAGTWKISLCLAKYHAWIRYENKDTGEVHTLSRFQQGRGGRVDPQSGQSLAAPVKVDGVSWDNDLTYEPRVRIGKHLFLSTLRHDPEIFLGKNGGLGYSVFGNTCVTFTRDAWHFYTGEYYAIDPVAMPGDLAVAVARRHPQIQIRDRMQTID